MSEYQYYEFLAIDRPLDDDDQAEVRSLSTRARITATSFVNEYHWGDFKGDPDQLMKRYYDAHLYVANWGALAGFLRLDDDLLAIAARTSPPLIEIAPDPDKLASWVTRLSVAEKDRLLRRVVHGDAARVRTEMLRRFRDENAPNIPAPPRRTVADLLDDAARRRADRERRLAAQRAEEEARREKTHALARERRLNELARDEGATWSRVDAMIATRKPAEYDAAIALLTDLRALAERNGRHETLTQRTAVLRQTHSRKPSLIERLDRAGV